MDKQVWHSPQLIDLDVESTLAQQGSGGDGGQTGFTKNGSL